MAGLNLLQEYLSDSEEEMENINNENKIFSVNKKKEKLPLPESISSWKGVVHHEDIVDDPLEHNGRVRSFKHERGNWATLVYIDYIPSDDMLQWIKATSEQIIKMGNFFEELHISLTRTLVLKFHWIDSFVEAVKSIADKQESFLMELSDIQIYCNEDNTRTFLGITVQSTNSSLEKLTNTLDKLMDEYQLPRYYEDPSYHISFFWCLGDQRKILESLLPILTSNFNNFTANHPKQRYVQVDKLKCKIGNKLYNFNLR